MNSIKILKIPKKHVLLLSLSLSLSLSPYIPPSYIVCPASNISETLNKKIKLNKCPHMSYFLT